MKFTFRRRACLWALAASTLTVGSALTARADIVVITGVNNQGTDNVLLDTATDVSTVTGTVGPAGPVVNFTSTSGDGKLSAPSSGQARVTGSTGNDPFSQLTFELASTDWFTRAVFNINAGDDGSVVIHVEGFNIAGGAFEDDFTVDASGENFFTVTAINGQFIDSISLTAMDGATFDDVRQVRLGGVVAAIPEPETYALLMAGLGAIGFVARRRKQHSA